MVISLIGGSMGKKVYTIEGKMYIVDDQTGDILTLHIDDSQIPPNHLKQLIKLLAQQANKNGKEED